MIIELAAEVVLGLVQAFLGVLPDAGDLGLGDLGLGQAVGYARGFDAVLPVSELLTLATLCLAVYAGIALYGVARTVWAWIPFKFT